MSQTNIITGQYVRISQAPASLAARIGAWGIDIIAIMIYFTGITYLITKISPDFDSPVLLFIFILGVYLPTYAYPLLCEVFFNGQSLAQISCSGIRRSWASSTPFVNIKSPSRM